MEEKKDRKGRSGESSEIRRSLETSSHIPGKARPSPTRPGQYGGSLHPANSGFHISVMFLETYDRS